MRSQPQDENSIDQAEQEKYEELFLYTNSKSHGMSPVKDAQIKEWNKTHPDCKIRSQYDNELKNAAEALSKMFDNLRAPDSALKKLSQAEQEKYEDLFNYTNSKSHGMSPIKDVQIQVWNQNHPDCQIKSQYDTKGVTFKG